MEILSNKIERDLLWKACPKSQTNPSIVAVATGPKGPRVPMDPGPGTQGPNGPWAWARGPNGPWAWARVPMDPGPGAQGPNGPWAGDPGSLAPSLAVVVAVAPLIPPNSLN